MHDELRQSRVEQLVLERQLLRHSLLHLHACAANANCCHELLRGIDARDRVRPQPPDQLCRQRPGAAADVEHALTGCDARELGEPRGERQRVPAHEPVVLVGPDVEAAT